VTDEPGATAEPELTGALVVLRPVETDDRETLRAILADPEVRRWWGPEDLEVAVDDLYDNDAHGYAILAGGEIVGYVQYAEENEPDYRHAGIDIFLGPAGRGLGFGPDAVRTLARYLFEVRGHHRLTIDPSASNERAIAVYERVGFRRVGVMRRYERGQDGEFHDGLLMDMLPGELT
jgi:aminoglycoside 6'-N-acetyltransferase